MIEGVQKKVVDFGLVPLFLHLGKEGIIKAYREIDRSEVEILEFVNKGSGGKIYRGFWKET